MTDYADERTRIGDTPDDFDLSTRLTTDRDDPAFTYAADETEGDTVAVLIVTEEDDSTLTWLDEMSRWRVSNHLRLVWTYLWFHFCLGK